MLAPVLPAGSIYRDSIQRVTVTGGLCRPAYFLLLSPTSDVHSWSSASSASSSPAVGDASARRSSLSFSDGDESFSDDDGVHELHAIALRMVRDGYMKGLIRAFGGGGGLSPSARHRGLSPDELLLESWFSELDVEWVLCTGKGGGGDMVRLGDGCVSLQDSMERWIRALKTMARVLYITHQELLAEASAAAGGVREAIRHFLLLATGKMKKAAEQREAEVAQFARFAEASILRMLDFVDAVAAAALSDRRAPETLPGMLQVYTCVAEDSPATLALFRQASMFDDMNGVFLRKRKKLSDAIWGMMEKVRASFLTDDSWQQASPEDAAAAGGVHRTTRLMMNYVTLLSRNEGALDFVLQDHHFRMVVVSKRHESSSSVVVNLIHDMIASLEKQLEKTSDSISDPGLRCIFLMNNCSFISQKVSSLLLPSWTLIPDYDELERSKKRDCRGRERPPPMEDYVRQPDPKLLQEIETDRNLDGLVKIQRYMKAYLDVSWGPVLSCLYDDISHGYGRYGGALAKFESEFRRIYAVQKLWKVPNPELRKRLRKAVIEKVVSGYSRYLAERRATGRRDRSAPSSTPHELEELLGELFEG